MGRIKKLKIALVNPPLIGHKLRGTGTYTDELYKALKKENEVDVSLMDFNSVISDVDIIHYPYFDPFFLTLPLINKKPTVVTVHDLIPLKFPEHFPKGLRGSIKWLIQKMSLKGAQSILTDSYASREDIMRYTNVNPEKVSVVYLGIDENYKLINDRDKLELVRKKFKLPDNFILHVGDVNYNKNIPSIIKAFSKVIESGLDTDLLLIGNGFVSPSPSLSKILAIISSLGLQKRVSRHGFIPINDLVCIYNLAKIYLQPSFAEGFGLPVLEAMACGCTVIASNVSSIPELVEDAGLLVDPSDTSNLANSIISLINNEKLQSLLIKKGLIRANNFNWEKTARETVHVYKQIL